jgi:Zn-dependent protease
LTVAAFFYAVQPLVSGIQPLSGLVKYLAYINLALVVFNLIPGFPLDGGRVFRAIVWALTKTMRRATLIAASVGRFFGLLFIFLGVLKMFAGNIGPGLWIALIGFFLDNAAAGQLHQVMFQGLLEGHKVSQAMSSHCPLFLGI